MIQINGQEGGGQIVRSALSLSLITGQPFHMTNIRGKRKKPGLKRQHLACVKAALEIGEGSADGADLLSEELFFHPGSLKAGEYEINIGSAGSTTLVAQTLIPALLCLGEPSHLIIEGGTHNPMAPTYDFFESQYISALQQMGYDIQSKLIKTGFAPAGGGSIETNLTPSPNLTPFVRKDTSEFCSTKARVYHYKLDHIVEKLSKLLRKKDKELEIEVRECTEAECHGLTLQLVNTYTDSSDLVTEMVAEYGLSTENLVHKLKRAHHTRHAIKAPVCNRLADQLILFMAQIPKSEIITGPMTNHLKTNIKVIDAFLPESLRIEELESGRINILSHDNTD